MPTSQWTPEVLAEIRSTYEAGATTAEIAAVFKCSPDWVQYLLRKRCGIQLRPRGVAKKATPEAMQKVVELYQAGKSLGDIDSELGISPALGLKILRLRGVKTRPKNYCRRTNSDGTLKCSACGESFPPEHFYKSGASHGKNRKSTRCRKCCYLVHVERTFMLTKEEFSKMWDAQGGKCTLCGEALEVGARKVTVDHCHRSGLVRSLLCPLCNQGLGSFRDNPETLAKALVYLRLHQPAPAGTL